MVMVEHGKMQEIAKAFGCTVAMVSYSLKGRRNGEMAKKIRHVALTQYDGVEMIPVQKSDKK